ncbi:DUF1742-domain-containing protein [Saitoella complicata NRRL Y-17804]|uniref:DUF1742-domain-containing protein n=1 Tax=Saitoella complicata (strain BCRC 22490 / CBS 7301 / JCM 7358 / NBRC 10748 / NRRL Y-17804) TaxID=698492 RepID=A0A0E9NFK5_SAICN|nr:DUF1742-domain-containing protein [Saitoella complicata NRRL Y-17804]ODQ52910.1 DUF1742-domain-containing protein [Saitoella complicata NRRL Y-17804]GAO48466.1 hypothetical protein G7K_2639-t1 [Saitoella complicata NRRL Y-17804]
MSTPPFTNLYHKRTAANDKPCFICKKFTTTVLITPDQSDFFYACNSHLSDTGFATPVVDKEAEAKKAREAEIEKEVERLKKKHAEKQLKKDKDTDKDADSDKKKDDTNNDKKEDKPSSPTATPTPAPDPRVFTLHRQIYAMRASRWRELQRQKKTQQMLAGGGTAFPSVPRSKPGDKGV